VRTTVSIDDQLLELAKLRAHERHQTLSEFIERAIQHHLGIEGTAVARPVYRLTSGMGPVPGVDASSNRGLVDALDEE
jgi:hypothetical protein